MIYDFEFYSRLLPEYSGKDENHLPGKWVTQLSQKMSDLLGTLLMLHIKSQSLNNGFVIIVIILSGINAIFTPKSLRCNQVLGIYLKR